jgi:hypothetical protein
MAAINAIRESEDLEILLSNLGLKLIFQFNFSIWFKIATKMTIILRFGTTTRIRNLHFSHWYFNCLLCSQYVSD